MNFSIYKNKNNSKYYLKLNVNIYANQAEIDSYQDIFDELNDDIFDFN